MKVLQNMGGERGFMVATPSNACRNFVDTKKNLALSSMNSKWEKFVVFSWNYLPTP